MKRKKLLPRICSKLSVTWRQAAILVPVDAFGYDRQVTDFDLLGVGRTTSLQRSVKNFPPPEKSFGQNWMQETGENLPMRIRKVGSNSR